VLTDTKAEKLINYVVVDHEEQLSSVLVLLEPLPDVTAFDAARRVCQRLHNVNGSPTLRQVCSLVFFGDMCGSSSSIFISAKQTLRLVYVVIYQLYLNCIVLIQLYLNCIVLIVLVLISFSRGYLAILAAKLMIKLDLT